MQDGKSNQLESKYRTILNFYGKDTKIILSDSNTKSISEIREGESVMAPDGSSLKVLSVLRSFRKLYKITYKRRSTNSIETDGFTCLSTNVLILRIDTPVLTVSKIKNSYKISRVYCKNNHLKSTTNQFSTKEEADDCYESLDKNPQEIEITLDSYLKSPNFISSRARLFLGPERDFKPIFRS